MIQYLSSKHKYYSLGVGMNIQPQSTQPISDDQELAKVLAGVNTDNDTSTMAAADQAVVAALPAEPVAPADAPTAPEPVAAPVEPEPILPPEPVAELPPAPVMPSTGGELDSVKQDAINELRPLVDKLTLPAEEKFDTYLLLIRSTDDKSLIAPAHAAARDIQDEARRAQALLDIIKEIDFLSGPQA